MSFLSHFPNPLLTAEGFGLRSTTYSPRYIKYPAFSIILLIVGKYLGNIPKRNPRSKWFISWEAWPEKLLPMWFQGLVYFMSPRHTGLVYEAALTTHYIQTDDVFMGISVSKVPDFNSGVIIDDKISAQNGDSYKKVLVLRNGWINSSVLFFHVPIDSLFMKWSSELHNT